MRPRAAAPPMKKPARLPSVSRCWWRWQAYTTLSSCSADSVSTSWRCACEGQGKRGCMRVGREGRARGLLARTRALQWQPFAAPDSAGWRRKSAQQAGTQQAHSSRRTAAAQHQAHSRQVHSRKQAHGRRQARSRGAAHRELVGDVGRLHRRQAGGLHHGIRVRAAVGQLGWLVLLRRKKRGGQVWVGLGEVRAGVGRACIGETGAVGMVTQQEQAHAGSRGQAACTCMRAASIHAHLRSP